MVTMGPPECDQRCDCTGPGHSTDDDAEWERPVPLHRARQVVLAGRVTRNRLTRRQLPCQRAVQRMRRE